MYTCIVVQQKQNIVKQYSSNKKIKKRKNNVAHEIYDKMEKKLKIIT